MSSFDMKLSLDMEQGSASLQYLEVGFGELNRKEAIALKAILDILEIPAPLDLLIHLDMLGVILDD